MPHIWNLLKEEHVVFLDSTKKGASPRNLRTCKVQVANKQAIYLSSIYWGLRKDKMMKTGLKKKNTASITLKFFELRQLVQSYEERESCKY